MIVNRQTEDLVQNAAVLDMSDGVFFSTGRQYARKSHGKGVLVRHCGLQRVIKAKARGMENDKFYGIVLFFYADQL